MHIAEFLEGLDDAGYPFADNDPYWCRNCDAWECTCGTAAPDTEATRPPRGGTGRTYRKGIQV